MRLVAPPAKTVAAEKPTAALKRKRGPEPLASPVKQRPIRLVSSVGPTTADPVPRVATGKSTATTSRLAKPTAGASSGTAARPVRRREPPSKTAAAAQAAAAASAAASLPSSDDQQDQLDPEDHPVLEHEPKQNGQEMRVIEVPSSPPTVAGDSLGSPMRQDPAEAASVTTSNPEPHQLSSATQQEPVPSLIVPPTIRIDAPHHDTPPIETLPPFIPVEADSGVRRTSRLRKSAQSRNDMPGDPSASNKPSSRSRKPAAQNFRFTFTDAYSEMSATALKNLTATNTVKNQAYLSVKLETAVIRKDGARPESPMVKIKTIAQREDEEKDRRKQERAARAARRSGGSNVSEIPGSSDLEPDSEDESDSGGRGTPAGMPRHQRGAGEEEDYETPHRAFKRMKLTEDGQEEVMEDQKKRVKWDRGLFTVVFLDEVKLGTRPYSKTVPQTKGCLAPTAKVRSYSIFYGVAHCAAIGPTTGYPWEPVRGCRTASWVPKS
ncbi:hypothetical protein BKA70DRAFT_21228 [Coprinopsis sp. MPI-PUGE-AT-0042]|nr:hypothetical protein BKA70DRAFT_21228 [Coprinopsis sp. MPI-PUGE-AT-0042]